MSSEQLHEPEDRLSETTIELHRAIVSLMEELEAVDWYQQRADATKDDKLKRILEHNRDEEMEHAMMVLEWIRRNNPTMDRFMREFLFTEDDIVSAEQGQKED